MALVDANGLATLNMRDLGKALSASTMSVYRHFRNKSDLLEAVVDTIVERFAPPRPQGRWQEQARAISLRVRSSMLAHPELADAIGREFRRSPTSLRVNTQIIERLREGGVSATLLPAVYWAMSSYTTGYALLEAQSLRHRRGRGKRSTPAQRVEKIAVMLGAVEGLGSEASKDAAAVLARPLDDEQFLFGLDCLIRGLEERVGGAADQTEA